MPEWLRFLLTMVQVSRPGLYHVTAFLYVMPAAVDLSALLSRSAILGLLFVVFPVNLVVYSMNDYKDVDIDSKNPRKGGFMGAQASEDDLWLCIAVGIVSCLLVAPFLTGDFAWTTMWNIAGIGVNWLYNFGPRLSRVPLLDMWPPLGYLLIIPFASKAMSLPFLNANAYAYFVLMTLRTQLWFQRLDIEADAIVGKRTTAVFVGSHWSAVGVLAFLACEFQSARYWECVAAQAFSGYGACVFLIELYMRNKNLTQALMGVGGIASALGFWSCIASESV